MGSGMPEIGSRISLISKADIRYEGKLFSVDPEECTIALSSVRSYGTEDREAQFAVPAQANVYDYILFRGTDIKDIRVLSTTIPNDPAIVQLSVPPSLHDPQFPSRSAYSHGSMPSMNLPNAPGSSRDQSQSFPSSFAGVVNATRTSAADLISKSHSTQNVPSEDDSRSSTPSTNHAKSNDANARVSGGSNADDSSKKTNNYGRDRQQGNRYQQGPRQGYQQRYQPQSRYQNHQSQQQQQSQPRYMQQQPQQSYRDYNRDNQYRNYNDYRDSYGPRQYNMQSMRNQQSRDGWTNYDQRNGRNRMGQNGQQRINYQSTGYQNQNRKPKSTLKFEEDFDFDKANSEFEPMFEQLRTQLEKTKLNDGLPESPVVKMNGDVESKKEDASNDVGSGGEDNDAGSEEKPQFYDKVKSFFDQISYESIERSKGLTARMDWKTERKVNSETFGQTALRRNNYYGRGGHQNGGNYYNHQNRNPNMANNYNRNRYNNRLPQQQQQQQQQQPLQQSKPMNQRRPFNSTNKAPETVEARSS